MTIFPDPEDKWATLIVKFAGLMFTLSVVGLVVLMVVGKPTDALERLVTPLITAVIVTGVLGLAAGEDRGARKGGDHKKPRDKEEGDP